MNAPSVDIKDILVANDSDVYAFGTNLFINNEPSTPKVCMTLMDTGGYDPETNTTYEKPTIQIRSRNTISNYATAYDLLYDTLVYLRNKRFTINSTNYSIWQQSDIITLGKDENDLTTVVVNIRIHRTSS